MPKVLRAEELRRNASLFFNRATPRDGQTKGIRAEVRKTAKGSVLELDLYDEIDSFWGIGPKDVRDALKEAGEVSRIDVRLNSPGGNVFDGTAIYNILKGHAAPVHVMVDGVAASIASVIAMAGDEVEMGAGTWMMVHRAWGFVIGNSADMLEMAGLLGRLTGELSSIYQARSGQTAEIIDGWIADETWFTGPEAVEAGLADSVVEESGEAAACGDRLVGSGIRRFRMN